MLPWPARADDTGVTARQRLLGLALVVAAMLAILTVLVRQHAPALQGLDMSVHESLRQFGLAHPAWLSVMDATTHIGSTLTVVVVDVLAFAVCLALRRGRAALFVATVGLGVFATRLGLRSLVARPRPADGLWPADGWAFPSGHAANSAAMAAIVLVTCWPFVRGAARTALAILAALTPVAVGLSRVAGGVHWPSDVVGSLLLAAVVILVAAALIGAGSRSSGASASAYNPSS